MYRKSIILLLLVLSFKGLTFAQETDSILFSLYAKNNVSSQSASNDGDYLVSVSKLVSKVGLYNLKTKKLLCIKKLQPWTELRGKIDIYHANNSSFGVQKFDALDPFPLLYVSHRENQKLRGVLQVYRILPFKSHEDIDDYDSLNVSLVQTIYFPKMTDENALGSPWTVIDKENNCMYTYSRNNRKEADNRGICRISKFYIPSIGEAKDIYLTDENIIESYEVDFKAPLSQGACIHKGMMYIVQGVSPEKYLWLRLIDLRRKKLLKTFNLKMAGFPTEPEGCFIYNNNLMISAADKRIFLMNIPIE